MFPGSVKEVTSHVTSSATTTFTGAWKSFQSQTGLFVNPEDPVELKEQSFADEFSEMTSLTRMQRIYGFFMALAMGVVFFVIAITFLPAVALFPMKFAFFFTCGNIFCMASTVFVVGVKKQCEMMMESHRFQAATAYVVSMFLTLATALHWKSSFFALVFAIVQLGAVLWYSLSFIPFARHTVGFIWSHLMVVVKPLISMCGTLLWKCMQCVCSR